MTELEILENKINKAIDLIEKLFQQNIQLENTKNLLTQQLKEKDQLINDLINNKETLSPNGNGDKEKNSQKEEKIKLKIQQILDKLESFEKLSNKSRE